MEPSVDYLQTEQYVASLYRALGYVVDRDTIIDGTQVDVIATKTVPGYGTIRLMVEVKLRNSGPVGKDEVLSYRAIARALLDAGRFSRAIMVSTSGFTPRAKLSIQSDPDIDLLDLIDLERSFLAVDDALASFLSGYRQTPVNQTYIDLPVNFLESYPSGAETAPAECSASHLMSIALDHPDSAIILFADYGAGKTTTLERIKASAAESFLQKRSTRVPIFFALKNLGETEDLETFIRRTFQHELGLDIVIETFWDLCDQSRFLLLLDGFDEITLRSDANNRADLLRRLSPLLFGQSPAILTSRPSFFVSADEYQLSLQHLDSAAAFTFGTGSASKMDANRNQDRLIRQYAEPIRARYREKGRGGAVRPKYLAYRLGLLRTEQIDEYLSQFTEQFQRLGVDSSAAVRAFIDSVYDLSDLIRRPILLDMVVASILHGGIDVKGEAVAIGPTNLYEAYTGLKLEIDWDKAMSRRSFLSPHDRQKFAERCALYMHQHDVLEVPEDDLGMLASKSVAPTLGSRDELLTDLRTCSFLTISDKGTLRFIHRSFQEFFFARYLKQELDRGATGLFTRPLPRQVLYFLGGYAFSDNEFGMRLIEVTRGARTSTSDQSTLAIIMDNLAACVMYSGEHVPDVRWSGFRVHGVSRRFLTFARSEFRDVTLELAVRDLEFRDCKFGNLELDCSTDHLYLGSCLGSLKVQGDASSVRIDGGELTIDWDADWSQLSLDNAICVLRLTHPSLDFRAMAGSVRLERAWRGEGYLKNARFSVDPATSDIWGQLTAEHSILSMSDRHLSRLSGLLSNCLSTISGRRSTATIGDESRRQHPVFKGGAIFADSSALFQGPALWNINCFVLGGRVREPGTGEALWSGMVAAEGRELVALVRSSGGLVNVGPAAWLVANDDPSWRSNATDVMRAVASSPNVEAGADTSNRLLLGVMQRAGLPAAAQPTLLESLRAHLKIGDAPLGGPPQVGA
jgi:hypothetical protein